MRVDICTDYLVKLYTVEHLTLRGIGKRVEMSAAGVAKRLKAAGIVSEQGEWIDKVCETCAKEFRITRSRATARYCSTTCYGIAITSPKSYIWRHGQRLARLIVAQHFDLQPEHVVHHKDGDNRNNDRSNLAVYASQADHTKSHRGGNGVLVWGGNP